jgi:hypothetical protein
MRILDFPLVSLVLHSHTLSGPLSGPLSGLSLPYWITFKRVSQVKSSIDLTYRLSSFLSHHRYWVYKHTNKSKKLSSMSHSHAWTGISIGMNVWDSPCFTPMQDPCRRLQSELLYHSQCTMHPRKHMNNNTSNNKSSLNVCEKWRFLLACNVVKNDDESIE